MNARVVIASVITAVWALTYLKSFLDPSFHADPQLNALMMIVAGFFFATGIRKE